MEGARVRLQDRIRRFRRTGDPAEVLTAQALIEVAEMLGEAGQKPEGADLCTAGWLHWYRYLSLDPDRDDPTDLMVAYSLFENVYRLEPQSVPDELRDHFDHDPPTGGNVSPAALLGSCAARLLEQARHDRNPVVLDAAVEHLARSATICPEGHPDWAGALSNLCYALRLRYGRTGAPADLDAAVAAGQRAAAAFPSAHPERPGALSNLGNALSARFERTALPGDIDAAVAAGRAAVATCAADDADPGMHLAGLGASLSLRYRGLGAPTDLEEAVATCRAAVAATPPGHPDRAGRLSNLAAVLRTRFLRTGLPADLDDAVAAGRATLTGAGPTHPGSAGILSNLGNALLARFQRTGVLEDLDDAVAVGRDASALTPIGHPGRAATLASLGTVLRARFDRTGRPADLDAAIVAGRDAVDCVPDDHVDRASALSNLANALRTRFERSGASPDLDEAVTLGRAAVAASPAGHAEHAAYLTNLGGALSVRFELNGASDDLAEALAVFRRAVDLTPQDHPARGGRLSSLGAAVAARFPRTRALADLEEAVAIGHESVAATPLDHPERAIRLANLGGALAARYRESGELADLDEAVGACRGALAATAAGHPDQAARLSNLALGLQARFERVGDQADLDEAVAVGRAAVTSTARDHPHRTVLLSSLGIALSTRFACSGDQADLDEAVAAGRAGAALSVAAPADRLRAARMWGAAAAAGGRWRQAAAGYSAATGLIGLVAPRGLARPDQEHRIGEIAGLGSDAAECYVRAGMVKEALEVFEQGRGVLLGQTLDTRTDLTALADHRPDLATRFAELRDAFDRDSHDAGRASAGGWTQAGPRPQSHAPTVGQSIPERMRSTAAAFDALLAQIRQVPGFAGFLRPPPARELMEAAGEGTIVVVNISSYGSHALVVTRAGVRAVNLAGASPRDVRERVATLVGATAADGSEIPDELAHSSPREDADTVVKATLAWLWEAVAQPVLAAIGVTGPPAAGAPWPRVWWCLSGLLSFLPVHAAGRPGTLDQPDPATVTDRVLSSYTPTIRSLDRARRSRAALRHPRDVTGGPGLVVAMPRTPGQPDLPGSAMEADLVRGGRADRVHVFTGRDATRDRVLAAMRTARWAHFACHGHSDLADPSTSHLLLHDHPTAPLTVLDVARLRLDDAGLAMLSACSTARPGGRLADEAIHLASAFQLAGYCHVVGTLWPVGDAMAVRVARDVHDRLAVPDADVAGVLHTVSRALRDAMPERPSLWASYLHMGP